MLLARRVLMVGVCSAGLASSGVADSARRDIAAFGSYALRVHRDADGLPMNTVHALTIDGDGFLWAGTQDGAAVYNGRGWRTVAMPDRERSNFVRVLLPAKGRGLWIGTQAGGLVRASQGQLTQVASPHLPVETRINALLELEVEDGTELWVGTYGDGLAVGGVEGWRRLGAAEGLASDRIWSLATTGAGPEQVVWVGTEEGLFRRPADSVRFVAVDEIGAASISTLLASASGVLWAGSYGEGLWRLDDAGWRQLRVADGLPSDFLTSLTESREPDGSYVLWVGTDGGGAASLRRGEWNRVDAAAGLPSDAVYSLLVTTDEHGGRAVWIGTRNGGLARLREGEWRAYHPVAEQPGAPVTALLESQDGSYWMGTDGAGLARFHDGRWTSYTRATGELPSDIVQALAETIDVDGRSTIWAGTRNGGLARFAGDRWTTFDQASGALPNDLVQCLLETRGQRGERTLWVGTRGGLAHLGEDGWGVWTRADGLPDDSVLSLVESQDRRGGRTLWIGTAGGLARRRGGRIDVLDRRHGLRNEAVQSLLIGRSWDETRTLWAGTDGGGVSLLDLDAGADVFRTFTESSEPALPNSVVYAMLQGAAGEIYLSTNRGVSRLTLNAPRVAYGPPFHVHTFNDEDGLPFAQGNRGAALRDSRDRIWFGVAGGAAMLDPRELEEDRQAKRLVFERVLVGGSERPGNEPLELRHDQGPVVFELALLSFFRERDTRYRTQLVGLEQEPSGWGTSPLRELTALPAGTYELRAWGRDYAGNVTPPLALPIVVRPPLWRSWWSLLIAGATLAGAVSLYWRSLLRGRELRERQLEAVVESRTRRLAEANRLLIELAYVDSLTSVASRRRFDELLDSEWHRALRAKEPLALILLAVDGLAEVNRLLGREAGDRLLQAVATTIADSMERAGDAVGRYAGSTFWILLPRTGESGAQRVAELLIRRVRPSLLEHAAVTLSYGVGSLVPASGRDPAELVGRAESVLAGSKPGS